MKTFFFSSVLCVLAGTYLGGCATSGAAKSEEPVNTHDDLTGDCENPRRYVVASEIPCREIVALHGRWIPSRVFADAPEEDATCYYTWSGEENAPVDRDALLKGLKSIDTSSIATPACTSSTGSDAELVEISELHDNHGIGSVGCDVCGMQHDGKVWVVLPPELAPYREIKVNLSTGSARAFKITGGEGVRQMSFTLPRCLMARPT